MSLNVYNAKESVFDGLSPAPDNGAGERRVRFDVIAKAARARKDARCGGR